MQKLPISMPEETKKNFLFNFFACTGTILCFVHIKLLETQNFDHYLFGFAALFSVVLVIEGAREIKIRLENNISPLKFSDLELIAQAAVGILITSIIVTGYLLSLLYICTFTFKWLNDPATDKSWASWIVCILVLTAGILLWWFRLTARFWYGLVEVGIGLCVAFFQIRSISPGVAILDRRVLLALLTAAVYLVVRGIDNMHQGAISEKVDPILKFIRKKISP